MICICLAELLLPMMLAAREHLPLRLSVAHSAIDHPPLGHLLFPWCDLLLYYMCVAPYLYDNRYNTLKLKENLLTGTDFSYFGDILPWDWVVIEYSSRMLPRVPRTAFGLGVYLDTYIFNTLPIHLSFTLSYKCWRGHDVRASTHTRCGVVLLTSTSSA